MFLVRGLGVGSNWLFVGRGSMYGEGAEFTTGPTAGYPTITKKACARETGSDREKHWVSQLPRSEMPGSGADIVIFQTLGDSMLPTLEGQALVLAVRITRTPGSSTSLVLVARVPDEIYVKRLSNFDPMLARPTLNSANPKYPSIAIGAANAIERRHVVGRITRSLAAAQ